MVQRFLTQKTTECCGHPTRSGWPWIVGNFEAKGQASTEGFCRASARQRWSVDLATPRRFAPSRTEMSRAELVFAGLGSVGGTHAGVECDLPGNTAADFRGALLLSFGRIFTVILSSLRHARIRVGVQKRAGANEIRWRRAGVECPGM